MKPIIILFLLIYLGTVSAQSSVVPGQQWQLTEGETSWLIEINEALGDGFFSTKLITGEVPKDHDLYVRAETIKGTLSFQFMFNYLLVTDSGFGFRCSIGLENATANQAVTGELMRYRGSVAGPQWSEELETCIMELAKH